VIGGLSSQSDLCSGSIGVATGALELLTPVVITLDFERDVLCTHVSLKSSRARSWAMLNVFDKGWLGSKTLYRAQVDFRES
jgi:hypothetical protein